MKEKIEKLERWRDGGKASPYVIDLNPTDLCNLNCKSCWQRSSEFENLDSSYQLSEERLKELVKQGIEMGVDKFRITGGGEPLMRKEIILELMKMIKRNGREGTITTNGTLLEEGDLDLMMKMGWDNITFSLDGPDKKTNDFLRGDGSFNSIKKSLEYLKEEKNEDENPSLKFNTVISNRNYDKFPEMIELAREYGVEAVSFETLTVHSETGKKLKLDEEEKEEMLNIIPEAKEKSRKYGIETNVGRLRKNYFENANEMTEVLSERGEDDFTEIACYEPWYHLVVKVDGSAQPCCVYNSKEENVKDKDLEEIWYGDFFKEVRQRIREKNFSEYCEICNASQVTANDRLREKLSG